MDYLAHWWHAYTIHFGGWMTFIFASIITRKGLREFRNFPSMLFVACIVSAVLSLFSSHSHVHYAKHFMNALPTEEVSNGQVLKR